jgi:hypothetical protein
MLRESGEFEVRVGVAGKLVDCFPQFILSASHGFAMSLGSMFNWQTFSTL